MARFLPFIFFFFLHLLFSFIVLKKVLEIILLFSISKKCPVFSSYFIISVFEFINIQVISIFNSFSFSLSCSLFLFLLQTLHASYSRLSFPSTRERSTVPPAALTRESRKIPIHSITRTCTAESVHTKPSGTSFLPAGK